VDVASETSKLAQFQILQQSNLQVLAQTNEIPKQILSLLQGRGN
jgi:flagellin-like hook-associated protein FlgL